MKQKDLFNSEEYVTQEGLDICFNGLDNELTLALETGDRERFEIAREAIVSLGKSPKTWAESRVQWADRANATISTLYRAMGKINASLVGLEEADRQRQRLQRRLNRIGQMAAKRGQLREDDGYEWLDSGRGMKLPRIPLFL